MIHGEKARSCCFSGNTFADMTRDSHWADSKELLLIPGAVSTGRYDRKDVIPFDRCQWLFQRHLK